MPYSWRNRIKTRRRVRRHNRDLCEDYTRRLYDDSGLRCAVEEAEPHSIGVRLSEMWRQCERLTQAERRSNKEGDIRLFTELP
jgi:hypothetical protein